MCIFACRTYKKAVAYIPSPGPDPDFYTLSVSMEGGYRIIGSFVLRLPGPGPLPFPLRSERTIGERTFTFLRHATRVLNWMRPTCSHFGEPLKWSFSFRLDKWYKIQRTTQNPPARLWCSKEPLWQYKRFPKLNHPQSVFSNFSISSFPVSQSSTDFHFS